MNKTHSLIILPIASIWLLIGYQVSGFAAPEPSKSPPQGVELQNNGRDISTLAKALEGRWVSEPLIAGKNTRLTYYFSSPNIWLTGQELDGRQVAGEKLRYKVIRINEKENSLRIRYGLAGSPETLDAEATVMFTPDRQGLVVIFHANGMDVPSLKPFKYAGSQPQP